MFLIGDSRSLEIVTSVDELYAGLQPFYCDFSSSGPCHCHVQDLISNFCSYQGNYFLELGAEDYGKFAVLYSHWDGRFNVETVAKESLAERLLTLTVGNDYVREDFVEQIMEDGVLDEYDAVMIEIVNKSKYMDLNQLIHYITEIGEITIAQKLGWGVCKVVEIPNPLENFDLDLSNLKIENEMGFDN